MGERGRGWEGWWAGARIGGLGGRMWWVGDWEVRWEKEGEGIGEDRRVGDEGMLGMGCIYTMSLSC